MEYLLLGFDSIIVSSLYYFYKKKVKTLTNIKNAPSIDLTKNQMLDNEVIDYGMIVGVVSPDQAEISSNFDKNVKGVIRVLEIREHGTSFKNNVSYDTNRLISRVANDVPFSLVVSGNVRVQVEDPLAANFLLEYLELTHKKFEPINESLIKKIFSGLVSNETLKGIETSETMLKKSTQLTAFGRIEKLPSIASSSWLASSSHNRYKISKSAFAGNEFVLTRLSRSALVEKLSKSTRNLKILLYFFTSLGAIAGAYCAYKLVREYLDRKKRERRIEEARQQRLKNQRARARHYDDELNMSDHNQSEQSLCVICLLNPRELVLLDCGHVCLCMDCYERMPNSNCPICRQRFRTYLPCYIP
ncbi:mitochondrial ubiquitin ligase activator of NFKB 1 [Brachionus plicatilis]|uniref:RING-type E3 ubiquitin transferase n=1 Tax=Brachionus plicatilis TaxID=10195 RepID=A0A3M7R5Q2_BRAPC|nr:mitochondrial ubiquitin ligase activator of NFKB 1 [Brachionus plicatilis]